jgi:thiol-disulfide isomerase/thioredoxin
LAATKWVLRIVLHCWVSQRPAATCGQLLQTHAALYIARPQEEEKESGKLLKIRTKKDLDALVQSGKKAVIKFWAPWCNKCRMIAPHVEELADKHKGVTVASFDTTADELETLTAELGVKGLPQFRFYKDGKETMDKIMGYKLAPLSEAFAKLDKL